MLFLVLASRIGAQIAHCFAWRAPATRPTTPRKPNTAPPDAMPAEDSMADAWIKQRKRMKEALARAQQGNPQAPSEEFVDEWVQPHIAQLNKVKRALTDAKARREMPREAELDDEWADPQIAQLRRVKEAIARGKREFGTRKPKH